MNCIFCKIIKNFILLALAVLSIDFLWKNTLIISAILLLISILILFKSSKKDLIFFVIIAISAALVESLTILTGAWTYSTQNLFIIPIWLPLYWGIGAIVIKDMYLIFKK